MFDLGHSLAFPEYAPLPASFVYHLLDMDEGAFREQVRRHSQPFSRKIREFEVRVRQARRSVWERMQPYALGMAVKDFRSAVVENVHDAKRESISGATIQDWREKGILPRTPRMLDLDRCAAILMAAQIASQRERGFLPGSIPPHEPNYYVYKRTTPTAPWTVCPLPLPDVASDVLLWTPWPTSDPLWLSMQDAGAIRWAGAVLKEGQVKWTLHSKDITLWNPELAQANAKLLMQDGWWNNGVHHVLAEATLYLLAADSLPTASFFEEWET